VIGIMETKIKQPIKVIIVNPPTKEQAEKRIKELASFLEKVWIFT